MTTLFISHSVKDKRWAEAVHAFLRSQDFELFLGSHPEDGIPAGAEWERELWQRLRRSGGVVVLCSARWLASPWCVAEAMTARERGEPVFIPASRDVNEDVIGDEPHATAPDGRRHHGSATFSRMWKVLPGESRGEMWTADAVSYEQANCQLAACKPDDDVTCAAVRFPRSISEPPDRGWQTRSAVPSGVIHGRSVACLPKQRLIS